MLKRAALVTVLVAFLILLLVPIIHAEYNSLSEIEQITLNYLAEKTGLPISVLSKITYQKTYDFNNDWYTALCYREPITKNDVDNSSESLILLSIYLSKSDNSIRDAQRNTGEVLYQRILQYRNNELTSSQYKQLIEDWEELFGPTIYWQYDVVAAFEILYHVQPSIINTDSIRMLNTPEAVLPRNNTISFQKALDIAKQHLSDNYHLEYSSINSLKFGSILKENDIPDQKFGNSNKTSEVYWVITFYSNNIRCYAYQILEDGTIEQMVEFSEDGQGIVYSDGIYY